jgi:TolB-like protein
MDRCLLVVLACLWGCAHAPRPPPPEEPKPLTFAVIEFGDAGREAENGCVMALLEAGYRVVDRAALDQVLPNDDDIEYRRLGRLLGADIIIDGNLPRGMKLRRVPPARMVSTETGSLLAVARVAGRVDRSFQTGQKVCADLLAQLP